VRIALIAFHFAEYAYRLASSLAKDNEVLLFLGSENSRQELGSTFPSEIPINLTIHRLPDRGLKNPLLVWNTAQLVYRIYKFNPAVVHCQETFKDYFIGSLKFLRRYPIVLTIHDHISHSGRDSRLRKRIAFYREYLRKSPDSVIVHGDRIARETANLLPKLKANIFSIPHGALGDSTSEITFDWDKGAMLFFGRIEAYKGLRYFIAAIRLLRSEGLTVTGIIAGTGHDLESYRSELESSDAFELIETYIPNDEIPSLFRRANAVILPYVDATQSGVAALAQQFGRPTVATNVGSVSETVRDGYNGLIVEPGNVEVLANAIRKIITNQVFAQMLGMNAKAMAEGNLSWCNIASETIKVYADAIDSRAKKIP
jgi:glycosyltransferase involved in cell wall biosynthesis